MWAATWGWLEFPEGLIWRREDDQLALAGAQGSVGAWTSPKTPRTMSDGGHIGLAHQLQLYVFAARLVSQLLQVAQGRGRGVSGGGLSLSMPGVPLSLAAPGRGGDPACTRAAREGAPAKGVGRRATDGARLVAARTPEASGASTWRRSSRQDPRDAPEVSQSCRRVRARTRPEPTYFQKPTTALNAHRGPWAGPRGRTTWTTRARSRRSSAGRCATSHPPTCRTTSPASRRRTTSASTTSASRLRVDAARQGHGRVLPDRSRTLRGVDVTAIRPCAPPSTASSSRRRRSRR